MTPNPRPAPGRQPSVRRRTVRRGLGAFAIFIVGTTAFWLGGRSLAGSVETAASTTSTSAVLPVPVGATIADWMAAHPTEIADARAKVDAARTAAAVVVANPTAPSALYDVASDAGAALRELSWALPAGVAEGVATKQRWFDCSGEYFGLALAATDLNREPDDAAVTAFQQAYADAKPCPVGLP